MNDAAAHEHLPPRHRCAREPARAYAVALSVSLMAACSSHGAPPIAGGPNAPARLRVTDAVIAKDLEAFGANLGGFGNSLFDVGTGFEPVVFRHRFTAQEDAADRVVASAGEISYWDTLKEGALDGADVRVYRIEDSRFVLVREATIPSGGFHASGWQTAHREDGVVPADATHFVFRFEGYHRKDVPTHFTVRAIDARGQLSDPAQAVAITPAPTVAPEARASEVVDLERARFALPRAAPAAPQELRAQLQADGTARLTWRGVDGAAGYVVYRSDDAPSAHRGFWFALSGAPDSAHAHVKRGDMVLVSKRFTRASRKTTHTHRVWGADNETSLFRPGLVGFFSDEDPAVAWELVAHDGASPVTDAGETFLRLTLGRTAPVTIGRYNHGGTAQDWLPVLETRPYTVEVWLRQRGDAKVRFRLTGFYDAAEHRVAPIEMKPGPEWKKFTATFSPPVVQTTAQPNEMVLEIEGPGVVDVDNFRVYRADAPHLAFAPEDRDALSRAAVGALRTHAFIKTGRRTYDMEQLTNPGGAINGTTRGNTLPQTLAAMKQLGVTPWLQVEPHMTPQEWLGLVEYLAAPYDPAKDSPLTKPWAFKRVEQGQARPWLDEFPRVFFELGNETWNGLFKPWTFDGMADAKTGQFHTAGRVYGLYQEYVRDVMRASPYWSPRLDAKLQFVLGGWNGFDYGKDAARASPGSSMMTVAAYNGGWDAGEGPPRLTPESYFHVLTEVNQSAIPLAERHAAEVRALKDEGRASLTIGAYEAGPGYALNGLNGAQVTERQMKEQEQVMKSLAAGTATLDAFLARATRGFVTQSFFTFDHGTHWRSHAHWFHGGHAYPSWKALALFNTEARGDLLKVETLSTPTADLVASAMRPAVAGAPMVAAYATRRGDRVHVFVISRRFPNYPVRTSDGFTPVTLELPFAKARAITLQKMTGDPRAHNVTQEDVVIETQTIAPGASTSTFVIDDKTGADPRGLPPASVFLYVFTL